MTLGISRAGILSIQKKPLSSRARIAKLLPEPERPVMMIMSNGPAIGQSNIKISRPLPRWLYIVPGSTDRPLGGAETPRPLASVKSGPEPSNDQRQRSQVRPAQKTDELEPHPKTQNRSPRGCAQKRRQRAQHR